ncbi:MAG: response regulator transcription factor [Lachnospiraceae bacterium]|jgi:DNA-binding response OmpR family regulator|nr:response regulator transcription factor [Lachnospiraceae bacterium]RKJ49840.1 DNA-binding response regulator [bacterium 1XD42-54]
MQDKILIVDDEADIVEMLRDYFTYNGYEVMTACCGEEAVLKAERQPDLILLDINMPGMDGLEVCRLIRYFVNCPILFLTARIEESDKIRGFGIGGDDYIVKPFSIEELGARVEAHLRREKRQRGLAVVKFGGSVVIDYSERRVYFEGNALPFAKKEFDIIELLSLHAGQVFGKERIYELVWGYDSEGESSVVAEHIRRIRAKLQKAGAESCIDTVWGVGYKWKKENG